MNIYYMFWVPFKDMEDVWLGALSCELRYTSSSETECKLEFSEMEHLTRRKRAVIYEGRSQEEINSWSKSENWHMKREVYDASLIDILHLSNISCSSVSVPLDYFSTFTLQTDTFQPSFFGLQKSMIIIWPTLWLALFFPC